MTIRTALLLCCAAVTSMACTSRFVVRAEAAVTAWNERLLEAPNDTVALEGRRVARTEQARLTLAQAPLGDDLPSVVARASAVGQVDALVKQGARTPVDLEGAREQVASAARALVMAPAELGQALAAQHVLALLESPLKDASQGALWAELQQHTAAIGARRCLVLKDSTRSPWLGAEVARYCRYFGVQGPEVRGFPELRGRIEVRETALSGTTPKGPLIEAVQSAFNRSLWHHATSEGAAAASVSGALQSEAQRTPVELTATWNETESYVTTETVLENYTEPYTTTEQRSVQVPYTTYESYSYSCGTTSYQTCTGSRPVTHYRTEYRSETVYRTRSASRSVQKSVTKYRPVSRSIQYDGIQHRVHHAGKLKVSVALPGAPQAVEVAWEDVLNATDVEHSTMHPMAGLEPHTAQVPDAHLWELGAAEAVKLKLSAALNGAWMQHFCSAVEVPELAARCAWSPQAPTSAWQTLATFFGESPNRLKATLRDSAGTAGVGEGNRVK